MRYQPLYTITAQILQQVADIVELLTRWSVSSGGNALSPQLRRNHRIRTIQASLAIENNSLSVEQVTAVLEGKRVLGLPREIQEVRNAFAAYEQLPHWQAHSAADLLAAHGLLMAGLVDDAGHFRTGGVGIYNQQHLVHIAPPASRVDTLMADLLAWVASAAVHPLIASCVFHYKFEFIHPFADGNGRMGRLWQTVILSQWRPVLAYLPVESVIRVRQADYYQALADADNLADATPFIAFMLQALHDAMTEVSLKTSGKALALLRENTRLTIPELALAIGVTERSIERNLQKLQQENRLRRVGSSKGGYWELLE
ncbi:Fic family protein [Methylovulum psychrotolerans]|uniref:Cell filamentation protein Fic n=1 Tax=Methylovulum psychrotolerans TaxID=1704499 RepID=A0A1Z4BY52_9GAMM|nr:Fic family protein [Methylovulum psychrotolerans]ASF46208.1 cell filamentation protein Fic [Methylovulum psychrotolerans]